MEEKQENILNTAHRIVEPGYERFSTRWVSKEDHTDWEDYYDYIKSQLSSHIELDEKKESEVESKKIRTPRKHNPKVIVNQDKSGSVEFTGSSKCVLYREPLDGPIGSYNPYTKAEEKQERDDLVKINIENLSNKLAGRELLKQYPDGMDSAAPKKSLIDEYNEIYDYFYDAIYESSKEEANNSKLCKNNAGSSSNNEREF